MSAARRRRLYAVALITGLLFIVGTALAQWLATGTGTGTAKARVAQPLTTSTVAASSDLYPGGMGDLNLTISNPNPYPVTVSSVTGNATITSDTSGCDASNHEVAFQDQTGLSLFVAAGSSATHVLDDVVSMGASSADACQGATFTIPVALEGFSGTTAPTTFTYYADTDGDGYGDPSSTTSSSSPPAGYVDDGTDCNDANASVNPGATEIDGDGIDNDCDGLVDEDGVVVCDDGDPGTTDTYDTETGTCTHTPVADGTACDDGDPNTVNDHYQSGVCTGTSTSDIDDDGDTYTENGGDCNDTDPTVYPGATEIHGDGIDNDCDGTVE